VVYFNPPTYSVILPLPGYFSDSLIRKDPELHGNILTWLFSQGFGSINFEIISLGVGLEDWFVVVFYY